MTIHGYREKLVHCQSKICMCKVGLNDVSRDDSRCSVLSEPAARDMKIIFDVEDFKNKLRGIVKTTFRLYQACI